MRLNAFACGYQFIQLYLTLYDIASPHSLVVYSNKVIDVVVLMTTSHLFVFHCNLDEQVMHHTLILASFQILFHSLTHSINHTFDPQTVVAYTHVPMKLIEKVETARMQRTAKSASGLKSLFTKTPTDQAIRIFFHGIVRSAFFSVCKNSRPLHVLVPFDAL